jgi:hypothetical protein
MGYISRGNMSGREEGGVLERCLRGAGARGADFAEGSVRGGGLAAGGGSIVGLQSALHQLFISIHSSRTHIRGESGRRAMV